MYSTTTRTLLGLTLAAGLALSACGGDGDGASPATTGADVTASAPAPSDAGAEGPGTPDAGVAGGGADGDLGDGEIVDELTDAMGEQGDVVDDAIASLPTESLWGIVSDQLAADDLTIDGADIRLTFDEGTSDNAVFDCSVANSFLESGQTVTMVYGDGEVICGR